MRLPYHRTIIVVCLIGFLICMALILSGCASTNVGKGLNVAVAGSAVADLVTTSQAEARGGREANPVMRDPAVRWLVKGAGVGAVVGAAWWLDQKQRPVLAQVMRVVAIAVNVAAAVHNASVLR